MPTKDKKADSQTRHKSLHLSKKTRAPRRALAEGHSFADFASALSAGVEKLVPERVRQEEFKDKFASQYDWPSRGESRSGLPGEPTPVDDLLKSGDPIVAFEPQLHRVNRVLHYWLEQAHKARFDKPEEKFRSISGMAKALHENLRIVLEVVRLLHEIYDTRTFNRLVLDAIKEIAPDIRLKIITRLQVARQELKSFKALEASVVDVEGEIDGHGNPR